MPDDLPAQSELVSVKMSSSETQALERIAYECSQPGDNVTLSDVIREATRRYLDDVDDPAPREIGRGVQRPAQRREDNTAEATQ